MAEGKIMDEATAPNGAGSGTVQERLPVRNFIKQTTNIEILVDSVEGDRRKIMFAMPLKLGGEREAFRPALENRATANIGLINVVCPNRLHIGEDVGALRQWINVGTELSMIGK
jgi:hypothetical protein